MDEMNIFLYIDDVLKRAGVPYYNGMPEFSEDEPEKYIVYNLAETDTCYVDNKPMYTEYTVTFNFLTLYIDTKLYKLTRRLLESAGFFYQSGGEIGTITQYPTRRQYYHDYKITIESEDFL